jgi:glutamyl-tRNA synthetase
VELDIDAFGEDGEARESTVMQMQFVLWRLEAQQDWSRDALFAVLKDLAEAMELKPKALFAPLFVALSGEKVAYSIPDSMAILGPDMTRARLRAAIDVCGGVSKKAAKRLEKAYADLKV